MKRFFIGLAVFLVMMQVSCTPTPEPRLHIGKAYAIRGTKYQPKVEPSYKQVGYASWYGKRFHKRRTANGDVFDKDGFTAAHKTLPLPSIVKVTNLENGKSVKVKVNDRGPFAKGRIIDVSEQAAKTLGFKGKGTARVAVEIDRKASLALLTDPKLRMKAAEKKLIQEAYLRLDSSPSAVSHENRSNENSTRLTTNKTPAPDERVQTAMLKKPEPTAVPAPVKKAVKYGFNDVVAAEITDEVVSDEAAVAEEDDEPAVDLMDMAEEANKPEVEKAPAPKVVAEPIKAAAPKKAEVKKAVASPKTPVAVKKAAVEKKAVAKKVAVAPTAKGNFAVQIAASTDKKEAERILGKVKDLSGKIVEANVNGKKYFRIRLVGFKSQNDAKQALINVQKKGFKDAFIVKG